jgi:hypothetical protein
MVLKVPFEIGHVAPIELTGVYLSRKAYAPDRGLSRKDANDAKRRCRAIGADLYGLAEFGAGSDGWLGGGGTGAGEELTPTLIFGCRGLTGMTPISSRIRRAMTPRNSNEVDQAIRLNLLFRTSV